MILEAALAAGAAWLLGALTVAALWPAGRLRLADFGLILSLGLGVGLGLTSVAFFVISRTTGGPVALFSVELVLIASAAWCVGTRRRGFRVRAAGDSESRSGWLAIIIGTAFAQSVWMALVFAMRAFAAEPSSNSDGWTIWNMHARVLFRGGETWPELLRAPQLAWTHPDYPLLVPASVARGWTFAGGDAPFVGGLISTLFGVATVGVLVAAAARLRTATIGWLGGLVMLGTPFFVTFSSNQHADIPLGFFLLAALVLLASHRPQPDAWRLMVLAGLAGGFAAWTKNEGLLFVVALGVVVFAHAAFHRSLVLPAAFLVGATVALLPLLYFKAVIAPPNDLLSSQPWSRWPDLFSASRHAVILGSLGRGIIQFGGWAVAPVGVMLLPLFGPGWRKMVPGEWLVGVVLALILAGFCTVYLLTPWDLDAHLESSLPRLLIQLWPSVVFFWCLALTYESRVAAPRERDTPGPPVPSRSKLALPLAGVVLLNLLLAAAASLLLARQLPLNQLFAGRVDGVRVALCIGTGWHGPERHGRDRWAWTSGESELLIRTTDDIRNATLRFTLRALGPRIVTIRSGHAAIWNGAVHEQPVDIEITGLQLSPGLTSIRFASDTPPILESDSPQARKLAFALYNPKIE